jgi:apolipoprotein N-acyltransferase
MTAVLEPLSARVLLLTHWRRALVALAAGAVLALALAPLDIVVAGFLAFPVLVWLLDGAVAGPRAGLVGARMPAFWTGWWFGFGYFLSGLWWIGAAVLVDAENFAWALPIAVVGLPALLAVFFGLACALANAAWRDGAARIFALAIAFGFTEWLRGFALTGFPWNTVGQTIASGPVLMQSAALAGVDGLTPIAVLAFAAPALLAEGRRAFGLGVPALVFAALAAWGMARPALQPAADAPLMSVRIVQPSIKQILKWDDAEKDAIFATLMRLTAPEPAAGLQGADAARPAVIVWPETALPFLLEERPQALTLIAEALDEKAVLLTGAIRVEGAAAASARYYNSVLAIDTEGTVAGAADKRHLVPFGEYLPLREWLEPFGLRELAVTPGAFEAGTRLTPLALPGGAKAVPLICYEVIFPAAVREAALEGDFLLNVTNDAWYGATPGPYQHFRQAQLRAVETGMPLVRAANNGLSAVVDPFGRILGGLALDAVAHSDVTFSLQRFATPYAAYGERILLGIMALMVLFHSAAAWLNARSRRFVDKPALRDIRN